MCAGVCVWELIASLKVKSGRIKFIYSCILYSGAMISFTGFALAVIYFPANPPKPPTEVQTKPREKFSTGLKKLLTFVPIL